MAIIWRHVYSNEVELSVRYRLCVCVCVLNPICSMRNHK